MKLLFFLFPSLALSQLDFSVYDEVVFVKTNSVPEGIKNALGLHPLLNYTEISTLNYPDNIVRETNILNHLYDNYWPNLKADIEKNLDKICVTDKISLLEEMKYLYKIHRQYMKNIFHVTSKDDSKCRVCDPFAYWFKLRLEEYTTPRWTKQQHLIAGDVLMVFSSPTKLIMFKDNVTGQTIGDGMYIVLIEVSKTQPQLREITRLVELDHAITCKPLLWEQILQLDNMFQMFYQIFLRDRPF